MNKYTQAANLIAQVQRAGISMRQKIIDAGGVDDEILGIWYSKKTGKYLVSLGDWAGKKTREAVLKIFGNKLEEVMDEGLPQSDDYKVVKAGARHSAIDRNLVQQLHDIAMELGASCDCEAEMMTVEDMRRYAPHPTLKAAIKQVISANNKR